MEFGSFINGMIVGMCILKIVEYKLKRSEKYQKLVKNNKFMKIIEVLREKEKKQNGN